MTLFINNSLTKKKEEFIPRQDKVVKMYTCGVTVYDRCHIGHARSLYIFSVIRRYLEKKGYAVNFVRNITDIDDKIINRAQELKKDWKDIVSENIRFYREDFQKFGLPFDEEEPRATENIDEMIAHIQGLIQKGYAYESKGDVYFRVRNFKDYGKLSGQSIEQMREAVRIEKDSKKEDSLDFALWKKSREGEPYWESPWGPGRPGWHIECSVMSLKYLNCETLDIHAGGRDLIFPHHENEIAQAEALTGNPFACFWIHHGLLTINGQKMAKSLGNFITIRQALETYRVDDLKLFFLMSHYASPVDFSKEKIYEIHKAWEKFQMFFHEARRINQPFTELRESLKDLIKVQQEKFNQAMDDDFNTPRALGSLFEWMNEVHKRKTEEGGEGLLIESSALIENILKDLFYLSLKDDELDEKKKQKIENLMHIRKQARQRKDYQEADRIRDQLSEMGIVVEDTKDGQIWRVT